MWKVGELMRRWEELQSATAPADDRQTIP
jgi:hypothetical protein